MAKARRKYREEARAMFLAGEVDTNAEIAARLGVKPHTVGKWRADEDWDGLRLKIDTRAAELFVEKIATDRMTLNVRHYQMWDVIVTRLIRALKEMPELGIGELNQASSILVQAQKGQRLAKGLSATGETEEQVRAEAEAENRQLIDMFIDAVKKHVTDEEVRDRIRQALDRAMDDEEDAS